MNSLIFTPAHELAEMIASKQASSQEVLEAHIKHINKYNPQINAIVTIDEETARSKAKEADLAIKNNERWGPLHGVPVTIKDAFETKGMRTTASYKKLSDYIPSRDATVVARLRKAGAIVLGKTNMSMLATDFQSDSPIFGRTNNPWNLDYTPGGSSGGSGAAVAAGMSPLDIGSDLGGSVRIPAHFCGVFGLKPTEHRVSSFGHIPDWSIPGISGGIIPIQHMGTYGPLARSIKDLLLCLEIMEGPDANDPAVYPVQNRNRDKRSLPEYTFAWCKGFEGAPLSIETEHVIERLATELDRLGCRIEERLPEEFNFEAAWKTWGEIVAAELASAMPFTLRMLFWILFMTSGRPPMDRGITRGIKASRRQYHTALSLRYTLTNQMEKFLSQWDALLCPVACRSAFTHRRTGAAIEVDDNKVPYMLGAGGYTSIFNLTGHPSVVIPAGKSKEGLPIGIQIVGRRWSDRQIINIADKLKDVTIGYVRPSNFRDSTENG